MPLMYSKPQAFLNWFRGKLADFCLEKIILSDKIGGLLCLGLKNAWKFLKSASHCLVCRKVKWCNWYIIF